jgi:hypothetical protein
MLGLRLTNLGQGLTDLRGVGEDIAGAPAGDIRNQILMTYTYTLHNPNAFPGILPPPAL